MISFTTTSSIAISFILCSLITLHLSLDEEFCSFLNASSLPYSDNVEEMVNKWGQSIQSLTGFKYIENVHA